MELLCFPSSCSFIRGVQKISQLNLNSKIYWNYQTSKLLISPPPSWSGWTFFSIPVSLCVYLFTFEKHSWPEEMKILIFCLCPSFHVWYFVILHFSFSKGTCMFLRLHKNKHIDTHTKQWPSLYITRQNSVCSISLSCEPSFSEFKM